MLEEQCDWRHEARKNLTPLNQVSGFREWGWGVRGRNCMRDSLGLCHGEFKELCGLQNLQWKAIELFFGQRCDLIPPQYPLGRRYSRGTMKMIWWGDVDEMMAVEREESEPERWNV